MRSRWTRPKCTAGFAWCANKHLAAEAKGQFVKTVELKVYGKRRERGERGKMSKNYGSDCRRTTQLVKFECLTLHRTGCIFAHTTTQHGGAQNARLKHSIELEKTLCNTAEFASAKNNSASSKYLTCFLPFSDNFLKQQLHEARYTPMTTTLSHQKDWTGREGWWRDAERFMDEWWRDDIGAVKG